MPQGMEENEHNNGNFDNPGLDRDERRGRTIDGHLPKSWKWTPLRDFCWYIHDWTQKA